MLDGIRFMGALFGGRQPAKPAIFNYYDRNPTADDPERARWAQTAMYKLYDTTIGVSERYFYNIVTDPEERTPLDDNQLTAQERQIKVSLLKFINYYVRQGSPIYANPILENEDLLTVGVLSNLLTDGGSAVTARGLVWDTVPNAIPDKSSYTEEGSGIGMFRTNLTDLEANKTYYIRTYAVNKADTSYSKEIIKSTFPLMPPMLNNTTNQSPNSFRISWQAAAFAKSYEVDISQFKNFSSTTKTDSTLSDFSERNRTLGWIFSDQHNFSNLISGKDAPSLELTEKESFAEVSTFSGSAKNLICWVNIRTDRSAILIIEGLSNGSWRKLDSQLISFGPRILYFDDQSPEWKNDFSKFRFRNLSDGNSIFLDDVQIVYFLPDLLDGYDSLEVFDTSLVVSGLKQRTKYFYRVRSKRGIEVSLVSERKEAVTTIKGGRLIRQIRLERFKNFEE